MPIKKAILAEKRYFWQISNKEEFNVYDKNEHNNLQIYARRY